MHSSKSAGGNVSLSVVNSAGVEATVLFGNNSVALLGNKRHQILEYSLIFHQGWLNDIYDPHHSTNASTRVDHLCTLCHQQRPRSRCCSSTKGHRESQCSWIGSRGWHRLPSVLQGREETHNQHEVFRGEKCVRAGVCEWTGGVSYHHLFIRKINPQ